MDDLLKKAGLTKVKLSRNLGLHEGTASSWKGNPPGYALAYLRVYIEAQESRAVRRIIKQWVDQS